MRPARERDLDRAAALFSLLLADHQSDGARFAVTPGGESALREALLRALREPDRDLRVAEGADENLLGFALSAVVRRMGPFVESARGEIEQLYVRPEARRAGAGRALAAAALAWLAERGTARVEVAVSERNAAGRAFWAALGFAPRRSRWSGARSGTLVENRYFRSESISPRGV